MAEDQADSPQEMRRRLAAVVPCYNAGGRLRPVIEGLSARLDHVVVVDDGSTDGACKQLDDLPVHLVTFPENQGKGFAMLEGFRTALAEADVLCVAIVDADGQHDPSELPNLYETFLREDADLVIGSRTFDLTHVPWRSRFGNKLTATITRTLLKRDLPDTQSGYRLHSRQFVEHILHTVEGGRYEMEMEILMRGVLGGFRVSPSPIKTIYEEGNPSSHFNKLRDSFRIYRRLFRTALRCAQETTMTPPPYDFVCFGCGFTSGNPAAACPACGEPLSIRSHGQPAPEVLEAKPASLWHYKDLLPITSDDAIVSLGEGATPLLEAPRLAERFGLGQLLLKNETVNPTGSFKDRQVSVGISHAREIGKDTVAVVSSGNVACAAGAYAARAGMKAVLLLHGQAAGGKLTQATTYGAAAIHVNIPSAGAVFDLCLEACEKFGWYHLSTAGMYEPFNVEGAKTIAYELYQQTGGDLPEVVVAPVGGGGLLGGIWRGFLDLERLGMIERSPRLVGVQASGCPPFVKAIEEGTPFLETLKHPWPDPKTIAGGIADDIIFDGHTALPAVRTTGGAAIAVDDAEIIEGELALAAGEGVLCEPTCAVVIAALKHLRDTDRDARVCCIVTGNGIKDLAAIAPHVPPPATIEPSLDALAKAAGESP